MNDKLDSFFGLLGIIGFYGGASLIGIAVMISTMRGTERFDQYIGWIGLIGLSMIITTIVCVLICDHLEEKKKKGQQSFTNVGVGK